MKKKTQQEWNRRQVLKVGTATTSGVFLGGAHTGLAQQRDKPRMKVERLGVGAIGLRYQGSVIAHQALRYADLVGLCDVDRNVLDTAKSAFGSRAIAVGDYQQLLARDDIDVITIGTPDHWHTKMVIDACRAGKDVYCEKPLTLTIDEGKQLCRVVKETGRVVQVGSWQRSDSRFRQAVELVRAGLLGKLLRVDVVLGKNKVGGPFERRKVPSHLDWNRWQGQTPASPYIEERSHYTFRWWYEYSGGQMTDWGAHHLDIAQWAIGEFPIEIEGIAKYPDVQDGYNVAIDFAATVRYPNNVVMRVLDHGRNGVMFTGDEGRIFVNRGTLEGKPIDRLPGKTYPRQEWSLYDFDNTERPLRAGKLDAIVNHMGNFFDCVEARRTPISDCWSQHRSVSTCHLGNIAMRVGRAIRWDADGEVIVGDDEANSYLSRPQRAAYEVV